MFCKVSVRQTTDQRIINDSKTKGDWHSLSQDRPPTLVACQRYSSERTPLGGASVMIRRGLSLTWGSRD